jgi:hypothetical protein
VAGTRSVEIKMFTGIDQSSGAHNVNMNVAYLAKNCNTEHGSLTPSLGYQPVYPTLPGKIVTLCSFYRRNHEVESERRVLVAATDTKLYAIVEGGSVWKLLMDKMESGEWSWVTYESVRDNDTPGDQSDDSVTDILVLSNAKDGVVVVYGDTLEAEKKEGVPKFAKIERHAERIWGIGVPGEPDNLYYSQPYNPLEWDQVFDPVDGTTVLPEQSGGVIQWPTWDGDEFIAIKRFSNNLLAFKRNSAFYVRGLSAGEFAMVEAYGSDGVIAGETIVTDGPAAFYLSDGGLGVYDGDTARLLDNDRLLGVFSRIAPIAAQTACATISRHVLYMTLPVYTGETYNQTIGDVVITKLVEPTRNNMLIEYDIRRGTYMVRSGIEADALHNHGGRLLFTGGSDPYQVYEIVGTTYEDEAIPVLWQSAWQDLGAKNAVKSGFIVHMTGLECADETGQEIEISIETERKKKTKKLTIKKGFKKTRFAISNSGRRFRFEIKASSMLEWSLSGGVQIEIDIDED